MVRWRSISVRPEVERWNALGILEVRGGSDRGQGGKFVGGTGESDEITRALLPVRSSAGRDQVPRVPNFHVGKRSTTAPSSAKTLQKIPDSTHAMDQTTALYALVSFPVLLISSVGFFNQILD